MFVSTQRVLIDRFPRLLEAHGTYDLHVHSHLVNRLDLVGSGLTSELVVKLFSADVVPIPPPVLLVMLDVVDP